MELSPEYTYYYVRVTEADGDLAVTAPVWVGQNLKLGIDKMEADSTTPLTGEELTIKQQLRKEQKKGGAYYFSPPKNGKSRTLVLPNAVLDLFYLQKKKQEQQMFDAGSLWKDRGLIFSNQIGDFLSYRTVYDCFKRIVAKIGYPEIRFHDLRHSYAVIAIKNGDDPKTVQGNLGHATAAFTLDVYTHVTSGMKQASADRMDRFISGMCTDFNDK